MSDYIHDAKMLSWSQTKHSSYKPHHQFPAIYSIYFDRDHCSNIYYRLFGKLRLKTDLPSIQILKKLLNIGVEPFEIYNSRTYNIIPFDNDLINVISVCFKPIPLIKVFLVYNEWYKKTLPPLQTIISECMNNISVDIISIITSYCIGNEIYKYLARNDVYIIKNFLQNKSTLQHFVRHINDHGSDYEDKYQWIQYCVNYLLSIDAFALFTENFDFNTSYYHKDRMQLFIFSLYEQCMNEMHEKQNNKISEALCKCIAVQNICDVNGDWRLIQYQQSWRTLDALRRKYYASNIVLLMLHLAVKYKWYEIEKHWKIILNDIDFVCDVIVHIWPWQYNQKHTNKAFIFLINYLTNKVKECNSYFDDCTVKMMEKLLMAILMILGDNINKTLFQDIDMFIDNLYNTIKLKKGDCILDLYHYDSLQLIMYNGQWSRTWRMFQCFCNNLRKYCGQLCIQVNFAENSKDSEKMWKHCFC